MFGSKTFLGAFVLSIVAAASPGPAAADSSCPSGTREHRSRCVLDSDLVLAEPLELQSFATLDCEGHRILPSSAGTGTTPESYVPSLPALAIANVPVASGE